MPEPPMGSSSISSFSALSRGPATLSCKKIIILDRKVEAEWDSASAHFCYSPGSVSLGPHSQPALSLFSLQGKLGCSGPEESKRIQAHEQHLKGPGTVGVQALQSPSALSMADCSAGLRGRCWSDATGQQARQQVTSVQVFCVIRSTVSQLPEVFLEPSRKDSEKQQPFPCHHT